MPVYRTPDGRIVEEKTVRPPLSDRRDPPSGSGADDTTVRRSPAGPAPVAPPRGRGYDEPTVVRLPAGRGSEGGPPAPPPEDERTQLHGVIRRPAATIEAGVEAEVDPVCGWLVVAEGPGAGRDLRIGVGRNDVGRDPENRIALTFGDHRVSRRAHLWLSYDNVNRVFSVTPGSSANLAYLNGAAIEERCVLAAGDTIRIGRTTLRFVAFCGDDFNWADED